MLKGDKVVLCPVRERDLAAFIEAHTELSHRGEFFPLGVQPEPVLRRSYAETGLWEREAGSLVIWNRDQVMVGHIEFFRPVSYWDAYELSYQLYGPEHAGQGYATEAVRLLVDYLFGAKKVNRLSLVIVPENTPSRRIADKCGFQLEGTARGALFHGGRSLTCSSTRCSATTHGPGTRRARRPWRHRSMRRADPGDTAPIKAGQQWKAHAMPLARYGVLAGRVVDRRAEGGTDTPHYQVHVRGGDAEFRVAVNVLSKEHPSELLYVADEAFHHPLVQELAGLPTGSPCFPVRPVGWPWTSSGPTCSTARRCGRCRPPPPGPTTTWPTSSTTSWNGPRPTRRPGSTPSVSAGGPEATTRDKVFGFLPGNGVHDIHMNQGNSQEFRRDDGVWQDGGLLLHYPSQDQWVAIFLAFQSQAWHTDDRTGHAISTPEPGEPGAPDQTVRIVAALVNPAGPAPEAETVTLVNASSQAIDLTGWAILDREKRRLVLDAGPLAAGEAIRVPLGSPVALGNSGGLITLLDPDGLKVDGVAYTKAQAQREGWSLVF